MIMKASSRLPKIGLERITGTGHLELKSPFTGKPTLTYKPRRRR